MSLIEGPAIVDIVTPFDDALACLKGKVNSSLTFAVGGIPDQTGTYQNNSEGTGKFVTQGAGDIVQSALFKTGVTLINRRDMGTSALEGQWGLIDLQRQIPATFVITGSINSLDFIPGGGAGVSIAGVGPNYRQNRVLVGLDLAVTHVPTGRIYGNVALRKQIFADEYNLFGTRLTGGNVVDIEAGTSRREAVNYALRQMLQLATFELLAQMMPPEKYEFCVDLLDEEVGSVTGIATTGEQLRDLNAKRREQYTALSSSGADAQIAPAAASAEPSAPETAAARPAAERTAAPAAVRTSPLAATLEDPAKGKTRAHLAREQQARELAEKAEAERRDRAEIEARAAAAKAAPACVGPRLDCVPRQQPQPVKAGAVNAAPEQTSPDLPEEAEAAANEGLSGEEIAG
ncbi:CsgG/HfaB family protein [Tropicimonas sp. IMCC34011]|uniref:CsgG/HfaB family protein n=1 Tax=Tropicimonas sp. IMCC34011 TaxID=2248759 RepID=UPI001300BDC8|nr:CsgG/HfaB family protein [Tropicimonas sp. IMCC34011]